MLSLFSKFSKSSSKVACDLEEHNSSSNSNSNSDDGDYDDGSNENRLKYSKLVDKIKWYESLSSKFVKSLATLFAQENREIFQSGHLSTIDSVILLLDFGGIVNEISHYNAEKFQSLLNSVLSEVMSIVNTFHGDVIKIYDTMIVIYWPYPKPFLDEFKSILGTVAILCAITIQDILHRATQARRFQNKHKEIENVIQVDRCNISVGIASGPLEVYWSISGNKAELILLGSGFLEAQRCLESCKQWGEFSISSDLRCVNDIIRFGFGEEVSGIVRLTSKRLKINKNFIPENAFSSEDMITDFSDADNDDYYVLDDVYYPLEIWNYLAEHDQVGRVLSSIQDSQSNFFSRYAQAVLLNPYTVTKDRTISSFLRCIEAFIPLKLESVICQNLNPTVLTDDTSKAMVIFRIFSASFCDILLDSSSIMKVIDVLLASLPLFKGFLHQSLVDLTGIHVIICFEYQCEQVPQIIPAFEYLKTSFAIMGLTLSSTAIQSKAFSCILGNYQRQAYCLLDPATKPSRIMLDNQKKSTLFVCNKIYGLSKSRYPFVYENQIKLNALKLILMYRFQDQPSSFPLTKVAGMIGRKAELMCLEQGMLMHQQHPSSQQHQHDSFSRQSYFVEASEGLGKTHLLSYVIKRLDNYHLNYFVVVAKPIDLLIPYATIQHILLKILGLSTLKSELSVREFHALANQAISNFFMLHLQNVKFPIRSWIERGNSGMCLESLVDVDIVNYMPLLSEILALECVDNDSTRFIKGESRLRIAEEILVTMLMVCCEKLNLCFLMDDIHFCDLASLKLLHKLLQTTTRGFIVFTSNTEFFTSNNQYISQQRNTDLCELSKYFLYGNSCDNNFSFTNTITYVDNCTLLKEIESESCILSLHPLTLSDLQSSQLPVSLTSSLSTLSEESSTELLKNLIEISDGNCGQLCVLLQSKLPAKIALNKSNVCTEHILLTTIRQFNRVTLSILSIASVIGHHFSLQFLLEVVKRMDYDYQPNIIFSALTTLLDSNLLQNVTPFRVNDANVGCYFEFKRRFVWKVVYDFIPQFEKSEIHATIGNILSNKVDNPLYQEMTHLTAFHYLLSDRLLKKLIYLEEAAVKAEKTANSLLALTYYEGLLFLSTDWKAQQGSSPHTRMVRSEPPTREPSAIIVWKESLSFRDSSSPSESILHLSPAVIMAIQTNEDMFRVDVTRLREKVYCWCGRLADLYLRMGNIHVAQSLLLLSLKGLGYTHLIRSAEGGGSLRWNRIANTFTSMPSFKREMSFRDIAKFQLNLALMCFLTGNLSRASCIMSMTRKIVERKFNAHDETVIEYYSLMGLATGAMSPDPNPSMAADYRDLAWQEASKSSEVSRGKGLKIFCDGLYYGAKGLFSLAEMCAQESNTLFRQIKDDLFIMYSFAYIAWLQFLRCIPPSNSLITMVFTLDNDNLHPTHLKNAVDFHIMNHVICGNFAQAIVIGEAYLTKLKETSSSFEKNTLSLLCLMKSCQYDITPELCQNILTLLPIYLKEEDFQPVSGWFKFCLGYASLVCIERILKNCHVEFGNFIPSLEKVAQSIIKFLASRMKNLPCFEVYQLTLYIMYTRVIKKVSPSRISKIMKSLDSISRIVDFDLANVFLYSQLCQLHHISKEFQEAMGDEIPYYLSACGSRCHNLLKSIEYLDLYVSKSPSSSSSSSSNSN